MKKVMSLLLLLGFLVVGMTSCSTYDETDDFYEFQASSGEYTGGSNDAEQQEQQEEQQEEEQKEEVWKVVDYVDEFGDRTGETAITNDRYFTGKFSNSATTDSELYVKFIIDSSEEMMQLYEYGNYPVKNSGSKYIFYNVKMKISNGEVRELIGTIPPGGDNMVLTEIVNEKMAPTRYVTQALRNGYDISFYIYDEDRPVNHYSFNIGAANFEDVYCY